MAENLNALSYAALGKQTVDAFTPVVPTVYVPYYKHGLKTDQKRTAITPIFGGKYENFQTVQGVRQHGGPLTAYLDPNTCGYWADLFTTKGTTTGPVNGVYTHPFNESRTVNPNSYTLDLSYGLSQVIRYWGVGASNFGIAFEGDEMRLEMNLSALGSNDGREIATVSTTTITLKTDSHEVPTAGFLNGDLVAIKKKDGSIAPLNTTITTVTPGTNTIVLAASAAAFAAGDMIVLRPGTIAQTLLTPFTFPKTFWYLGASNSAALSAAASRLEPETSLALMHKFVTDGGERRFGGKDPASLVRSVYNADFKLKTYFDNPDLIQEYNTMAKRAVVMRAFSGSANEYELQIGLNDIRSDVMDRPIEGNDGIMYHEADYISNYSSSDGNGQYLTLKNAVSTI
jgi:hypothetical protein